MPEQNKAVLGLAALGAAGLIWWVYFRKAAGSKAAAAAGAVLAKSRIDAIVISGPSGVGKGTLINRLRAAYPAAFGFSVSHTTRAPRAGEVNGKDYHFVTKEEMQRRVANGEFLESCEVHGNMYGTSKAALQAVRTEGKLCIIEMDVNGAQKLKAQDLGPLRLHYIFITAPMAELERRIAGRGQEDPAKIAVRLETAKKEFAFVAANPTFYDTVLENDNLDNTFDRLVRLLRDQGVGI